MKARIPAISLLLVSLNACIVVPIPTPEWGGDEPITREQFDALENGVGSLTEDGAIELLGSPQHRYAEGRVLIYEWVRHQGLWIVGAGYTGDILAGESEHRLCLMFDPEGTLEASKHIDSALFAADAQVADLLDEWLGAAAAAGEAPGYAPRMNSEGFSLSPHKGGEIGVMLFAESEPRPTCWNQLNDLETEGYRFYTHEQLRDEFYPWLEPPWLGHLGTIASGAELDAPRDRSKLRFLIVVASGGKLMAGGLCDGQHPLAISCYEVSYRGQHGRIAILDLEQHDQAEPDGAHWISIPVFPTNQGETCRALVVYAMADVQTRVNR